jgi:hypothetical protein
MKTVSAAASGARHIGLVLAEGALVAAVATGLVVAAAAATGNGPAGARSVLAAGRCVHNAPSIDVENSYGWGQWGSWGMAGQKLGYQIKVTNNDTGCRATTFTVDASAPTGFTVSQPTTSISVKSASAAYLWAYVTSSTGAADGDYTLVATIARSDGSDRASFNSLYRVYSSDSEAPTLFWPNPGDGQTLTGKSYTFVVSGRDDHAVKSLSLSIDGSAASSTTCDDVTYTCTLSDLTSVSSGQHSATFRAWDWMGNVGTLTVTFTQK